MQNTGFKLLPHSPCKDTLADDVDVRLHA